MIIIFPVNIIKHRPVCLALFGNMILKQFRPGVVLNVSYPKALSSMAIAGKSQLNGDYT
jgi:hypothetical protein